MQTSFKSKDEILQATQYGDSSAQGIVLCPPHPRYGGSRNDTRIVKVARELASHNIFAFCLDYGSYGKGVKEVQNVLDAISLIRDRVDSLGLFGYSFGAVVASNVVAEVEIDSFVAMSILNKANGLKPILDFECPKLFVHGKRDNVAPYPIFEQLYSVARGRKEKLVLDTDHFFMDDYPVMIDSASRGIRRFLEATLSK